MRRSTALLTLILTACGAPEPGEVDLESRSDPTAAVTHETDARGDESEVRVRAGQLTLWMTRVGRRVIVDGRPTFMFAGRTSRNLDAASSFVPDDPFGRTELVSARGFEVALEDNHEIQSMASGLPLFVSLRATTGSPTSYAAALHLRPRLASFSGSSSIRIDADLFPVYVEDRITNLRYRGRATVNRGCTLTAQDSTGASIPTAAIGNGVFRFDLKEQVFAAAAVRFTATCGTRTSRKTAVPHVAVVRLGLTAADAYDTWPIALCRDEVFDCMRALPEGTIDFASCGTYREVARCFSERGPLGLGEAAIGEDCFRRDDCADAQAVCGGLATDRTGVTFGRCQSTQSLPGEGAACTRDAACGTDLICAGLTRSPSGLCGARWMRGIHGESVETSIPDADANGITRDLLVFGLGNVDTDVILDVAIRHPYSGDLRVVLENPAGAEVVVRDQRGGSVDDIRARIPVIGFSGDESVNGYWKLKLHDLAAIDEGVLESWSLEITSRWD